MNSHYSYINYTKQWKCWPLTLAPQTKHIVQPNSLMLIHIYSSTEANGITEGFEDFRIRPTEPLWLTEKASSKKQNTIPIMRDVCYRHYSKQYKNINITALIFLSALFCNKPKRHLVKDQKTEKQTKKTHHRNTEQIINQCLSLLQDTTEAKHYVVVSSIN